MSESNKKTIGIIALAGNCEADAVNSSKRYLEDNGYNVILSSNIYSKNRYLAGDDESKIKELHSFFENPDIDIVLNARGGYGTLRLIKDIDYSIIKNNPKPFCGFSDITALLLMLYKKTGIETYHSPMACSDFGNNDEPDTIKKYNLENLLRALSGEEFSLKAEVCYCQGSAKGILWGGNLSVLVSLCGQDFIPNDEFLFFAEDLNEPVYKIDRMFSQLLNMEEFRKGCKGILLGDFLDTDNKAWLEDYFAELSAVLKVPMLGGFRVTHNAEKITLPIGRRAIINDYDLNVCKS